VLKDKKYFLLYFLCTTNFFSNQNLLSTKNAETTNTTLKTNKLKQALSACKSMQEKLLLNNLDVEDEMQTIQSVINPENDEIRQLHMRITFDLASLKLSYEVGYNNYIHFNQQRIRGYLFELAKTIRNIYKHCSDND
jgi:hypothetical protein